MTDQRKQTAATTALNHAKLQALAAWDHTLEWTHKKSLRLPTLGQFVFAIFSRQRGGLKLDERRKLLRKLGSQDFLVIVALSLAYFCSVFSRVGISVLAPELQVDPDLSYDAAKHGQLIVTVQICSMIGKLINGFIIDMANPRYMLLIFMIGSASTILVLSWVHSLVADQAQRFSFMHGLAALNALFQSGIWTASTKFIHDHFRPAQFGKAIVVLAVFGKLGSVGALLILNAFVTSGNLFWIDAQRFASGITFFGTIALLFTFLFPHPAPGLAATSPEEYQEKKQCHDALAPSDEQLHPYKHRKCSRENIVYTLTFAKTALLRWLGWWSKRQFVLVAIANASMAVVCSVEGLEAFLTMFFFNGIKVTSSVASQSAIVLPLGVGVSLLIGGFWIERLDRPSKADVVIFMLLFTSIASVILLVLTGEAEALLDQNVLADTTGYLIGIIISIFLIGLSMGYAFFVPISTFAMTFGGDHAALATATLSVFASCVGAVFSAAVGTLGATSWTSVMGLVTAFAVLAFLSMTLFYYFELVDKRRNIAAIKQRSVISNLQELVLHHPQYEHAANGPAYDSSFFKEHSSNPRKSSIVEPAEALAHDLAVAPEGNPETHHHHSNNKNKAEKLSRLVKKYGHSLRHDGNHTVSYRIGCFFSAFFLSFGIAAFAAYFVARSNPSFVYPFGDVDFANRTGTNSG